MGGNQSAQAAGSKDELVNSRVQSGNLGRPPSEIKCAVPVTFRWPEPAHEVFVVGSYSQWQNKVYLTRQPGGGFQTVLHLPPGEYEYKFIVDGDWKCTPSQTIVRDKAGNENHWILVEEQDAIPTVPVIPQYSLNPPPSPRDSYSWVVPDPDDYLKDPPILPPQMQSALLNSAAIPSSRIQLLPNPHQCQLRHLFLMDKLPADIHADAVGCSHRYGEKKFVTTVYFLPNKSVVNAA